MPGALNVRARVLEQCSLTTMEALVFMPPYDAVMNFPPFERGCIVLSIWGCIQLLGPLHPGVTAF